MRAITRRCAGLLDAPAARLSTAAFHRRSRGVTMIEYVVMVAIVIVLAALLRTQLTSMFTTLLNNLKGALR